MRKFLLVVLAIVFVSTVSLLYITRDTAASHEVLRQSELPPLIPTRAFYADPRAAYGYTASSDAAYVSHSQAGLSGLKKVVREVASGKIITEIPANARHVRWHPAEPRIRFTYEGHDWEVDIFNSDPKHWNRISPVKLSGGWLKNRIATGPDDKILTWGKSHLRAPAHMWLVSQDGLEAEKVAEGTDDTQFWVFSESKQPILRFDSLDPATQQIMRKTDNGWQPLLTVDLSDQFLPVSNVKADATVLMISARGRDKSALVTFNLDTLQETVVLENPDADIGVTFALTASQDPDFIQLGANTHKRHALTERGETFLSILEEFEQPVSIGHVSPTASGRYVTAAISPAGKSFVYPLIDLQEKSYELLGEYHFRRFKDRLVEDREIRFSARDGLDIPAILVVPEKIVEPIPFIVQVHGGPASHSGLGYDHDAQFLVNRGYGILKVNFRGSTGYGKAFQSAGDREFGRKMQDDITDAAHWLIEQQLADPNALVVMGMSYGGYASALAMSQEPGLFDAAIVEFPMLDPEFQSKHHPGFWENYLDGWWRYFGKPDVAEDLLLMRKYSPLNRIENLHGPILILAGLRDQITAVQQVRQFEEAAKVAGKDVTTHYFPEAGHGLRKWRDKLTRARLIEDFLAREVGGRSGGFELVELAPGFIK